MRKNEYQNCSDLVWIIATVAEQIGCILQEKHLPNWPNQHKKSGT